MQTRLHACMHGNRRLDSICIAIWRFLKQKVFKLRVCRTPVFSRFFHVSDQRETCDEHNPNHRVRSPTGARYEGLLAPPGGSGDPLATARVVHLCVWRRMHDACMTRVPRKMRINSWRSSSPFQQFCA